MVNHLKVLVSACSKYIVVSIGTFIFLTDVNGGKTIKSVMAPFISENENICNTRFSADSCVVFICYGHNDTSGIMVWRPYLDVDIEGRLITLWRKAESGAKAFEFSRDNTMVVIHNKMTNTGMLWSSDTDHKCLTKKLRFQ